MSVSSRIVALRYVLEGGGGYWEVQTEEGSTEERYASLRQFAEPSVIVLLAARAIEQPGRWVRVVPAPGKRGNDAGHESG